jgi:nucleotidyltransferase/DNA polymerase involved in DNA repair
MIACLLIPGFELRAALRSRPGVELRPAALAPVPGTEPLLGPVTRAAETAGVQGGMRLGEALATCPELVLVDPDPAAVEQEWERVLQRLEDVGLSVDPVEPGVVVFETKGVERLYGGVAAALQRALAAVGTAWDPRAGAAGRRFAALAAASVARPGQILIVTSWRRCRSRCFRSNRSGTRSSRASA